MLVRNFNISTSETAYGVQEGESELQVTITGSKNFIEFLADGVPAVLADAIEGFETAVAENERGEMAAKLMQDMAQAVRKAQGTTGPKDSNSPVKGVEL